MVKLIVDFLVELDINSKLMEVYKKDFVGIVVDYGLLDEELKLIENKDWDEVVKCFDDISKVICVVNY